MKSVSLSPFQCPLQSCLMVGLSCQGMMLPGHFWHHLYNKKTIKDRLSWAYRLLSEGIQFFKRHLVPDGSSSQIPVQRNMPTVWTHCGLLKTN